jgi:hypothetical protein
MEKTGPRAVGPKRYIPGLGLTPIIISGGHNAIPHDPALLNQIKMAI